MPAKMFTGVEKLLQRVFVTASVPCRIDAETYSLLLRAVIRRVIAKVKADEGGFVFRDYTEKSGRTTFVQRTACDI